MVCVAEQHGDHVGGILSLSSALATSLSTHYNAGSGGKAIPGDIQAIDCLNFQTNAR